ncbi:hypothetical protein [Mesobacillus subterraneus]|uniref:hypothetical protein n=1 Tax=Mesobacillus subterraneus TaxID=285983 RepID=UPI0014730606|nr:hypothetical protein [Mesobacillus subterraneus]
MEEQSKCPMMPALRTKSDGGAVKMSEDASTSDKIRWRSCENVRRWQDFGQNPVEEQ